MSGLRIGVDIDDVLTGWYARAHEISLAAGITNGMTPTSWAPFNEYGCTDQEWYDVLSVATLDGRLYSTEPYAGVVEALQRLKDAGHTIHLVTARGFLAHGDLIRERTIQWLAAHQIPHDTLTFSKRKSVVRTDYFIDDSEKNVKELADLPDGPIVYLLDQPHNRHFYWPRRIESFVGFADEILTGAVV